MRVAVTQRPGVVELHDRPDPGTPKPGQTLLEIEMVGVCGSDLHLYHSALGASHDGLLPVVQGHEFSAIVRASDPDSDEFQVGDRVATWPVMACGTCRTCRQGRGNACQNLELLGVHRDGALQERLLVDTANLVATPGLSANQAALVEPVSIAVHTVNRGRIQAEEQVAVFGGGPIGISSAMAARDRGADVLVIDPVQGRRELLRQAGLRAEWPDPADLADLFFESFGKEGPHVIVDTTGRPAILNNAIDLVGHGGRIVVVGMTGDSAPLSPGLIPIKELDILGVSCCIKNEFAAAAELVRRNAETADTLISHTLPLDGLSEAYRLLDEEPEAAFKVMIDVRSGA